MLKSFITGTAAVLNPPFVTARNKFLFNASVILILLASALSIPFNHADAATFLYDTFNDTNGTLLENHTSNSGATYATSSQGYTQELEIFNNGMGTSDLSGNNTNGYDIASAVTPSVNQISVVTLHLYSNIGSSEGVMMRAATSTIDGYLVLYAQSAGAFYLYRAVSATFTQLASVPYAFSTSTLQFIVSATGTNPVSILVSVGGSNVLSYTDNSPTTAEQTGNQFGIWSANYGSVITSATGVHIASILGYSPLVSGSASYVSAGTSTIDMSVASASDGVPPYGYQWYRSLTAGFVPGPGTLITGATGTTLDDTPPSNGPWFYKCVVTDSASSTATSNQVAGTLEAPVITSDSISDSLPSTLSIVNIGDSITYGQGLSAGQDPVTQMQAALSDMLGTRTVVVSNQGHNGSQTSDWLPGAGSGYLSAAITAGQALNPSATVAMIMLGANDAGASNAVASSTYASNLSTISNYLLAHGFSQVILNDPTYIQSGANSDATNETSTALTQQYMAQVASLANGTTILAGDTNAYAFFQDNPNDLQADQTHPTTLGAQALGTMWATAALKALGITLTPTASFTGEPDQTSSSIVVSLADWASTGSQTITLTSDNSSDIFTASSTTGTGSMTYTLPIGASLLPYTVDRPTTGTSNISVTNGQGWTNPNNITYSAATVPVVSPGGGGGGGGNGPVVGGTVGSITGNAIIPAAATTSTSSSPAAQASSTNSVAQLQTELNLLLAQIAALGGNASISGSSSTIFLRNLTVGAAGADVKALQQYLNEHGFTLAVSGLGSPGNETTTFGAKTRAALAKLQKAVGIAPAAGYFGPKTRTYIEINDSMDQ